MADRILKHRQKDLLPHFIGAIVLQIKNETFGEARRVLVVDGQQRLATLQLLLKATQNAFKTSLSDTRKFEGLDKLLFNDRKRTGDDYLNETQIRQSNSLDQADFQKVIRDRIDTHHPPRNITKAYKYFHENVSEWVSRHANQRETAGYFWNP